MERTDPVPLQSVLPEDIDWKPFPAFPPSVRLAVVVGQPSEPGPYVIRVKVPSGVKLMPHRHPEDRIYTVMSGVFYIGLGDRFDGDKVEAYPPGSVIVLPGNTWHFHWAKSGEYVTQVTAIGPLGLEYLDPADDPRERHETLPERARAHRFSQQLLRQSESTDTIVAIDSACQQLLDAMDRPYGLMSVSHLRCESDRRRNGQFRVEECQ